MNLNVLIAHRIGKKAAGKGKLSRISNIIASVSVGLSIAIMIVAIAIAGGFRSEIWEKASGFSGDITLQAPGVDITNHQYPIKPLSYTKELSALPFVESLQAVSYRTGTIKTQDNIQGVLFKGVGNDYNFNFYRKHLIEGSLPDFAPQQDSAGRRLPPSNDIIISKRLAQILDFKCGDKVTAYFIDEDVTLRRFTICGIYDAQLDELDKALIIADQRHISRLNGWNEEEISGYEILLKEQSRNKSEKYLNSIDETIYRYSKEEDPSVVPTTMDERYYILFDWLHLLDLNVVIILALMIAVAGFNMISGLLIILFERISQIGLFKALGMRTSNIIKIFLYRAASIVLAGLIPGNIAAILFCILEKKFKFISLDPSNYFVDHVPVNTDAITIILLNAMAFTLIMLIMLVPCRMISRISPSKSLKVE
ncbi:MAG: ABC transporter permease [Bacteroidales bacterium]|nr:ABC transporter permease [Bacteroidales bacterium]